MSWINPLPNPPLRSGKGSSWMRAKTLLAALAIAALTSAGCAGGMSAPDFGSIAPPQRSQQDARRNPPDDRTAFRSIPARGDATVEILAPATLFELYREILQTYVDPIDHGTLIEGALNGIQAGAIEEGVLPLDTDMIELMSLRLSRDPERDWAQFSARYESYLEKLANRVGAWPVGQAAARGMVEALGDPNSTYMDRRTVDAQRRGDAGIGVTLAVGAQRGSPIVREVLPGSPAEAAGLRPGDSIAEVDRNPTSGLTLSESTQLIRGADSTRVQLSVRSAGENSSREVTVTRAPLTTAPVVAEVRGDYEYVKVRRFQEGVARSVQDALAESARNGAQGWIIDLRATSSGSIQEVMDIAGLFVGPRIIGAVVDRSQRPAPIRGQGTPMEARLPTVVLIDGDTGSGAEILAAALHEYDAATLVGAHTAGRVGLSQVVPLPDGSAAQITSQRIRTPTGGRLEGVGIEPDYPVESNVADWVQGRDPQLSRAMAILRDVNAES
jgi:carboxyl-terminal processing protease